MHASDRAVIVGAGVAGVRVAGALREQGHAGAITLISAESRLPYDRPPLSKAALLEDPAPDGELLQPETFYRDHDIVLRLGTPVCELDSREGAVQLVGGARVPADVVVLATGGSPSSLALPGADLAGVCTLRTAPDAARIRGYLQQGGPVAVVGGGFIGSEIAAAAGAWGCPVSIIEAAKLPMLGAVGPEVAARLAEAHRARGARVYTDAGVQEFRGDGRVREVLLHDGTVVPADLVVIGVGMVPNTSLARAAGLQVGDGVRVDAVGRSSNPAVWAVGDVASTRGREGSWVRSEHWQHARTQAERVARSLLGFDAGGVPVPWFWSDQGELNIQLAGWPGSNDARSWRGAPDGLAFSVLYHRGGAPTGVTAVNRGKDVRPAMELIEQGTPLDTDLLADPQTTLKTLAKSIR